MLSNNLEFSEQISVLFGEQGEKGTDGCSTPRAQPHPGPCSIPAWEGSPSSESEAGTQLDAVPTSGPGELSPRLQLKARRRA